VTPTVVRFRSTQPGTARVVPLLSRAGDPLSAAGGLALATATRVVAAVRQAAKPLHPRGSVVRARLERHGLDTGFGVPLLDEPGTVEVLARTSRAIGLPRALPDVHGLALRVPDGRGSYGDLLFATTGLGRVTRFVLTASRAPGGRPMTTLLPYSTASGPVVLAARVLHDGHLELACAVGSGDWQRFGELHLLPYEEGDQSISFDPVRHQLPGLAVPAWVGRLREPAYEEARHSRGEPLND